jgi:cysteine desulfuration protein SufE
MSHLPAALQQLVELFASSPRDLKVHALVDYSNRLADPPARYNDPELLTQVHECQTPFFVAVEIDDDQRITVHFKVPRESPTIRGYAGILADGLNGATAREVLEIPPTFYTDMGLEEVVSPLRLRGMGAILHRIKQVTREHVDESDR